MTDIKELSRAQRAARAIKLKHQQKHKPVDTMVGRMSANEEVVVVNSYTLGKNGMKGVSATFAVLRDGYVNVRSMEGSAENEFNGIYTAEHAREIYKDFLAAGFELEQKHNRGGSGCNGQDMSLSPSSVSSSSAARRQRGPMS